MVGLGIHLGEDRPLRVLCLGAHSDDIEIGCGGTLLKLLDSDGMMECYWVVLSADSERKREAIQSATSLLGSEVLGEIVVKQFRGSFFPSNGSEIKEYFEQLKGKFSPDLILTHYRNDFHQDHRTVSELTWSTFRDHLILEYEIPKYDGDMGSPNVYIHLTMDQCNRKIECIMENFKSQESKQWFSREVFLAVMRLRGMESNAPTSYAEGFYSRKLILE